MSAATERAERLRRTAVLLGPFASRYKTLAASIRADLMGLPDETLEEIRRLGSQAFHGDPADAPFEVMEVGHILEVQAAILINQREADRRRQGEPRA